MRHFYRVIGFVFAALLYSQIVAAALPSGYSGIVVFGDSLSDIGNYQTSLADCNALGGTSAPVTNHQGGAYPGKIWVDFLNQYYGFVPSKGSKASVHGNDWAVAGALTPDVLTQIKTYTDYNQVDSNALYIIWVGANDVMFRLQPENQIPNHPVTPEQVVVQGIWNIFGGIAELYSKGARHFLVIGMPDMSLTPGSYYLEQQRAGTRTLAAQITQGWNNALMDHDASKAGRAPLAYVKKLYPDIKIYTWDPKTLFTSAVKNPSAYHFRNVVDGKPNNQVMWCAVSQAYPNPDDFIFYNAIHPTAHGHQLTAQAMMNDARLF